MRHLSIVTSSLLCLACVAAVSAALVPPEASPRRACPHEVVVSDEMEPELDEPRESLAGRLLVAAPHMEDPVFSGTVIFMLLDDEAGALGVVLNRPRLTSPRTAGGQRLWDGGPVGRDRAFVLHGDVHDDDAMVVNGIAVDAEPALLDQLVQGAGPDDARVFLGYAGWAPGQLDAELDDGAWLTADADAREILSTDTMALTAKAYVRAGP